MRPRCHEWPSAKPRGHRPSPFTDDLGTFARLKAEHQMTAYPRIIFLVSDEDALGQHDVNANVSVHELSNAYVTYHAGQHISLVVAQMLL